GMQWLEPLVEIDGNGFGPATTEDVDTILDGSSDKAIGRIEEHPFIAKQQRLTFARAGKTRPLNLEDYEATGGWAGLRRARQIGAPQIGEEVTASGLPRSRGAGLPPGINRKSALNAAGEQEDNRCH